MSTEQLQPLAINGTELDSIPQNDYVRPLHEEDERTVKTLIGLGIMEGLPRANNKIILNPLCILLILSLGYLLNRMMAFMPNENIISWFTALIGPCLASLPILGLVEYIQRPDFISLLRRTMGSLDLVKFSSYCSDTTERSKNSGWVFIHNDQVVGTILVDSQRPGEKLDTVLGAEEGEINENKNLNPQAENEKEKIHNLRKRKSTSTSTSTPSTTRRDIIQIRHFAVDSPYTQSTIPLDLLIAALDHSFNTDSQPQSQDPKVIIKLQAFFNTDLLNSLKKIGFTRLSDKQLKGSELELELDLEEPEKIGVLGWRGYWMVLRRKEYEERRKEIVIVKD